MAQAKPPLLINGAGATFPYILYSKWLSEYAKINTSARINYRSIGSGGGIRQLINGTLDFGASDVPMNADEIKKSKKTIIHIPTTLSAVALTYNLPSLKEQNLLITLETAVKIFKGEIKKWNDPQIASLNPKLNLPDQDIIIVYRADGSGTTAVFTEYLTKDPKWQAGRGKSINWPVGIGGKGNEGVLGLVQKMEGALGYVGMSYALNQNLPVVHIQNSTGLFIPPTPASVKSSAGTAMKAHKSYMQSIVHSKGKNDYPISSFTYILIYEKMPEKKGKIILQFIQWILKEGQKHSPKLHYVELPQNVIQKALKELKKIKWTDTPSSN